MRRAVGSVSSDPDLRIGVVGLGAVAEAHLAAYRTVSGLRVVAAADVSPERVRVMQSRLEVPVYHDYREMIAIETLDAVCVLTPAAAHRSVTVACARAGLHVLCEKPLAAGPEEARIMIDECRDNGVKLAYGASYRFLPAIMKARELVAAGVLGDVVLLQECVVGGRGASGYRPLGPAHYPHGQPGGSGMGLVDHGIHLVDAFSWLLDSEIVAVWGRGTVSGSAPVTEFMVMDFANGATGYLLYNDFTFSTDLPNHGMFSWGEAWDIDGYQKAGSWTKQPGCIHIHGTEAALRVQHYANALYLTNAEGARQIEIPNRPAPAQFALQMESFIDCIRTDAVPAPGGQDGLRALNAVFAAYESDRTGAAVVLGERDEPFASESRAAVPGSTQSDASARAGLLHRE